MDFNALSKIGVTPFNGYGDMQETKPKRGNVLSDIGDVIGMTFGPQAFHSAKQMKEDRKYQNALADMSDSFGAGDYSGVAQALAAQGDFQGAVGMLDYNQQQQDANADREAAEKTQKLQGMAAFTQNMRQIPEAQRGQWAMDNWQMLEPIVGKDFMTFWQESGGDVSDASLDEDLLAIQTALGQGPQQAEEYTLAPGSQRFRGDQVIASVDPKPAKPNLPTGMVMGENGSAEWLPGYLDGQKEIAAARGGNQQNVQSTFTGQDGQLYVVRRNGQIESTGKQVRNPYQIVDVGGVNTAVNRLTGEAQSLTSAQEVGQNKATINTIVQNEEDRQASQKDLPLVVEEVQRSMAAIDGLLAHEGFDSRYGMTSMIPAIPGTAGAGAQAYIDQIGGQAFLQAFQSLKGGGQITEIEGQKATQAITRLTTQGIPPDEARQAAQELKTIMQRGLDRAKAQAGGSYAPQAQDAKPLVFNPETGEFE